VTDGVLETIAPEKVYPEEWDIPALNEFLERQFSVSVEKINDEELEFNGKTRLPLADCDRKKLHDIIMEVVLPTYNAKVEGFDAGAIRNLEKSIMLQIVDSLWKDHLLGMDHMKEGIGLRGYAQKNPLTEYKKEGFEMFQFMMNKIQEEVTGYLFKISIQQESSLPTPEENLNRPQKTVEHRGSSEEEERQAPVRRDEKKVGRNDPCHCGSGKKFKKCHGK